MANTAGTEFEIKDPDSTLTPRQREVLAWIVEGKENDAIAILLGITLGTVKFHVISLLRKFNAPNRQLLISRAWKAGLVHARHMAIGLLIVAGALPGTHNEPATVRTLPRVRVSQRRETDTHIPLNLAELHLGDRETA